MTDVTFPPLRVAQLGRGLHDIGLAGLLGGNLFGRLALHPAVTEIADPRERGKVVNAAWRYYGAVNAASLATVSAGWIGARQREVDDRWLSGPERRLARARDVLLGVVAVSGIATAVEGVRFSKTAPDGAVPLADGDHTTRDATESQARLKRRLNALGLVTLVSEAALVGVNAAFSQESFRRPSRKRMFRRSG